MKIKQVEELVGITSKNIRFYESQGLLIPERAENGYREYRQKNIDTLKKIKLSIKKVENSTGYELRVATSKKFKKTLYKKSYKKVAFTLKSKKLANKKKLYIKVRAYVLDGTNKIYGKWSKVKKVKIK